MNNLQQHEQSNLHVAYITQYRFIESLASAFVITTETDHLKSAKCVICMGSCARQILKKQLGLKR